MTKTEARGFLKRAREGIRDAEAALKTGDFDELDEALNEIGGCAGTIQSAMSPDWGEGLNGICTPGRFALEADRA